jgi:hypothetical protein
MRLRNEAAVGFGRKTSDLAQSAFDCERYPYLLGVSPCRQTLFGRKNTRIFKDILRALPGFIVITSATFGES